MARHHAEGKTHYEILGVETGADKAEIKKAFYDLNPDSPTAHAHFVKLSLAYEILSDPSSRRDYDLSLPSTHFRGAGRPTGTGFGPRRTPQGGGSTGGVRQTGFDNHDRFNDHSERYREDLYARSFRMRSSGGGGQHRGSGAAGGGSGAGGGLGGAKQRYDFEEHQRMHYGENAWGGGDGRDEGAPGAGAGAPGSDFDTIFTRTEHRRRAMKADRERRSGAGARGKTRRPDEDDGEHMHPVAWAGLVVGVFVGTAAGIKWSGVEMEGSQSCESSLSERRMIQEMDRGRRLGEPENFGATRAETIQPSAVEACGPCYDII
ncbi:hypothetical protein HDU93_001346 [Gonapodya sp. JEL0774]|nr:hypothetical protein HDU93_001346 [Gonapodya sp. JEL0774]